ncbi:hypothetical protein CBM2586_A110085 [Cupriavidus phytorum]|uniref:Uncharacterized protein n=2 Tax=Cupriavidus TaxID=106589 RepID=A0A975X6A5_9BURK|nr:hypothetical protein CBM2586_A110085 [Cupriavidus taiwanensis]
MSRTFRPALRISPSRTGCTRSSYRMIRSILPSWPHARMADEDQAEFAIGMKYAYDAYIRGSLIAHVVQRTKACMSKAELELLV